MDIVLILHWVFAVAGGLILLIGIGMCAVGVFQKEAPWYWRVLSALIAVMLVAVAILCYGDDAFGLGYGSLFADEDVIVQCDACGQWFVDADGDGVCDNYENGGRHMGWGRNR